MRVIAGFSISSDVIVRLGRRGRSAFVSLLFLCFALQVSAASDVPVVSQHIEPSVTGKDIDPEQREVKFNYVVQPANKADRSKGRLFVMIGGGTSSPDEYFGIIGEAANMGLGAISLRYPNASLVKPFCGSTDRCYTKNHGERVFGANTAYGPSEPAYASAAVMTKPANSIINRLVCLLDYLAGQEASPNNPDPSYWKQFIVADDNSPYVTAHTGRAYPVWSKIILAGHSVGAAHVGFLANHLPVPIHRVILFSGPDDDVHDRPASWIKQASVTPLENYWAMRHVDEGMLGSHSSRNWTVYGGPGGIGGQDQAVDKDIGDGTADPEGAHRLVLSIPVARHPLTNHSRTASDRFDRQADLRGRTAAWDYLISGNYAD